MSDEGIQKLFAALAVSKKFRGKFLNPETRLETIEKGYLADKITEEYVHFDLSQDEIARLLTTEGENPAEFARNFFAGAERR